MKIILEISALVEKSDIFGNLRHVIFFWIFSGVNKVSVVGQGIFSMNSNECKKESVFQHFTHILRTFPISRYFPVSNK